MAATNCGWVSDDNRLKFLEDRINGYKACLDTKKYKNFLMRTAGKWNTEFPMIKEVYPGQKQEDLTAEEQTTLNKVWEKRQGQMREWFRNRCKPRARKSDNSANLAKVEKSLIDVIYDKDRKKKAYEKFAEMYGDLISSEYNEACEREGKQGRERLQVWTRVAKEKWKNATTEQSEAVEKALAADEEENPESPAQKQKVIESVPSILTAALGPLSRRSGLAFFVTYIDPYPESGGAVKMRTLQLGEREDAPVLGEIYPDYEQLMLNQLAPYYNLYVRNPGERTAEFRTKTKAVADALKARKPLGPSSVVNMAVKPNGPSTSMAGSQNSTLPSVSVGPIVATPDAHPPAVEAQAPNFESGAINGPPSTVPLPQPLDGQVPNGNFESGAINGSPSTVSPPQPLDAPNANFESDAINGPPSTIPFGAINGPPSAVPPPQPLDGQVPNGNFESGAINGPPSTAPSDLESGRIGVHAHTVPLDSPGTVSVPSVGITPPGVSQLDPFASINGFDSNPLPINTDTNDGAPLDFNLGAEYLNNIDWTIFAQTVDSTFDTNFSKLKTEPNLPNDADDDNRPRLPSVPGGEEVTQEGCVQTASVSTILGNNELAQQSAARRSQRAPAPSTRLLKQDLIGTNALFNPPPPEKSVEDLKVWFDDAIGWLNGVRLGERFEQVVRTWEKLEEILEYGTKSKGTLPMAALRPAEWKTWTSKRRLGRRDYNQSPRIAPADAAEFGLTVLRWWDAIQPQFRQSSNGAVPQPIYVLETAVGDVWSSLRKGGPNGLVMVVILLAWWGTALKTVPAFTKDSHPEWEAMVLDVTRAFEEIHSTQVTLKRPAEGEGENVSQSRKRSRTA